MGGKPAILPAGKASTSTRSDWAAKDVRVVGSAHEERDEREGRDAGRQGSGYGVHGIVGQKHAIGELHDREGSHGGHQRRLIASTSRYPLSFDHRSIKVYPYHDTRRIRETKARILTAQRQHRILFRE